jgi:rusticyanin
MTKGAAPVVVAIAIILGVGVFAAGYLVASQMHPSAGNESTTSTSSPQPSASYSSYLGAGHGMYLPQGTLNIQDAVDQAKVTPSYANVIQANRTVVFTSSEINITVMSMGVDRARNMTGMPLPSYSTDNVFVIDGLINPTLVVPNGATLHLTVVNLDEDAYHDFVISTVGPPYPSMVMQGMMASAGGPAGWGMMGGGGSGRYLYTMPVLYPADYTSGWAPFYSYTVSIPGGAALWYLCSYPGHAQSGMYGEIVSR